MPLLMVLLRGLFELLQLGRCHIILSRILLFVPWSFIVLGYICLVCPGVLSSGWYLGCVFFWSLVVLFFLISLRFFIIKWSLGLSKFCRSTPLLRALGVQRIPAMRDHQSVNLLKRCLAGSSAASTFYWSLIHNRGIDVTRTLVNKLNLVDNSISRVLFGNTRRLFYDIDNDGLSDSVRFLLHNMNNDNFRILQNILYVDF